MELNEMEKRMLYQTEGSERYAILHELLMGSRYAKDPERRRAADSLMGKLRPLTDKECMEIVNDIRRNYRLPKQRRTIGELIAEERQKSGAEQLKGHDIMALDKGDRMRLFLTDAGYGKFQEQQEKGEIKIQEHLKVAPDGYLYHDHSRDGEHIR